MIDLYIWVCYNLYVCNFMKAKGEYMIWHSSSTESVIEELKSNLKTGLTNGEASARLEKINSKIESKKERHSLIKYVLDELHQPVYYILVIAIMVALLFHLIFNVFTLFEIIALLLLTGVKAFLGGFVTRRYKLEINKGETIEKSTVKVLRDGNVCEISSSLLVPGDIIQVEEGDYIPADARLITQNDLHCDEFAVTGESVPTPKDAQFLPQEISAITERTNMIYAGSYVVSGSGIAIITEITDYTEYGKLQKLESTNEEFSLGIEQRLTQLSKLISIGATVIYALLFLIAVVFGTINSVYTEYKFMHGLASSLMLVGALGIAFIPSFIETLATASISRGIDRMKRKGISIYQSKTVDNIAKLDVICADKTGAFTQNKMLLTQMYNGSELLNVTTDVITSDYKMLLRLAALCCDGEVSIVKGIPVQSGDATQTAIIAASMEYLGLNKYDLDNIYPRMYELPFDPEKKTMTTINVIDGKKYVIVRGQPQMLIPNCINNCDNFIKTSEEMSAHNLRVVGVATKLLEDDEISLTNEELENNLQFVGLLGLSDIPRLDSRPSVIDCQNSGMKVVMITGDHKSAALITAMKLNIANDESQLLTGEELDELDDDKLCQNIDNFTVFAQVNSQHRTRIISAYKNNGHNVAITGDSLSNTEALRAADVGYSMGSTGSDVAICASEVIIEDDSFSTVVDSVRDCRGIYGCISKSIKFFLSASLGILLSILLGYLIFGVQLITAPEIIFIALFSISAMALGLVYEPSESQDINLIIDNDFEIFKISFLFDIIFRAAIFTLTALVSYSLAGVFGISPTTFTFFTMAITYIFSAFISRTNNQLVSFNNKNKHFLIFAAISVFLITLLIIIAPGKIISFGFIYWIFGVVTALVSNIILLAIKFIRN